MQLRFLGGSWDGETSVYISLVGHRWVYNLQAGIETTPNPQHWRPSSRLLRLLQANLIGIAIFKVTRKVHYPQRHDFHEGEVLYTVKVAQ